MIFDDLFLPFFVLEPALNPAPEFSLRMAAALEGDLAIENRPDLLIFQKEKSVDPGGFPFSHSTAIFDGDRGPFLTSNGHRISVEG